MEAAQFESGYVMAPDTQQRLAIVNRVLLSGLPPRAVLDRFCQTAAAILDTPMAFVSLVLAGEIRYVAAKGLSRAASTHDSGLCAWVVEQHECLVILDARKEPRGYSDAEHGVRFYAGAPIRVQGVAVGALAVADSNARKQPSSANLAALTQLSGLLATEIEQRLESSKDVMESFRRTKLDEVKRWFAYGLSHEYTNALTGAMALEQTLESLLPSTASPVLTKLSRACSRMADLTRNFIFFHEGGPHAASPLKLNELTGHVSTLMQYVINEQIDLTVDLSRSVEEVEVETRGLEYALALILVRGRNVMEGKGTLSISTVMVQLGEEKQTDFVDLPPGNYATVSITNRGQPPADSERAALAGSPVLDDDTPSEASSLWLAQETVNSIGGQIDLETLADGATSFTFYLPVLSARSYERLRARKSHLLVVEDAPILAEALQSALSRAGFHVTVATRADQALKLVSTIPPVDLLIADVLVPGMNGIELARKIRETDSDLPVILISGQTDRSHFEPSELEHVAVFLQKPFTIEALLSAITRLLRNSRPEC